MLLKKECIGTVALMGGTPAILTEAAWAFFQMSIYTNEYMTRQDHTYIHYDISRVSYHAKARNELCQVMKGDWILMLDGDHIPDPDLVVRMANLFSRHKLDVLCGQYLIKAYPYPPLLYTWNEDYTEFILLGSVDNPQKAEVFEIGAAGGGCLMIRRNVIYRILTELKELPFDITKQDGGKRPLSEDLSFFKRCHQLGITPYTAANVENPHILIQPITMSQSKVRESGAKLQEYYADGLMYGKIMNAGEVPVS